MPRLSDSMEEGTIVRWLRADGDTVARGDEIVEIETDKATMAFEADRAGVLRIVAGEGDTVALGAVIATLGEAGKAAPSAAPPAAPAPAGEAGEVGEAAAVAAPASMAAGEAGEAAADAAPLRDGLSASPVARRLAAAVGIDLARVAGTGPHGRILKADVAAAAAERSAPEASPAAVEQRVPEASPTAAEQGAVAVPPTVGYHAAPDAPPAAKGVSEVVALTRVQQLIARRMAEAKATMPEFALTMDVDMEAAVALRAALKEQGAPGTVAPSLNDLIVKACAAALARHPRANGSYRDGAFELHGRVNVGVAVAAPDALVVPVVLDADRRSLSEVAAETRRLAERVRDGAITPPELAGATFTVSNLGMFGVTSFQAVLNPPQAAILAVGAIEPRAVVVDGAVVARRRMTLTLTCDHRILYGADAAAFLAEVRDFVEQPLRMLA